MPQWCREDGAAFPGGVQPVSLRRDWFVFRFTQSAQRHFPSAQTPKQSAHNWRRNVVALYYAGKRVILNNGVVTWHALASVTA